MSCKALEAGPESFDDGEGPGWDGAVEILDRLDPHRVYGSAFFDRLFRKRIPCPA
ncbi:hypothetical protein WBG99_01210 [Streptomyces sp. TG1A-60]|uniref:hypothetical protein n=1 Tax=Streptomyces sp. TG1A-60 TaxID=3129111 RepID=UPI0030D4FC42